jgi:hypothetical protein
VTLEGFNYLFAKDLIIERHVVVAVARAAFFVVNNRLDKNQIAHVIFHQNFFSIPEFYMLTILQPVSVGPNPVYLLLKPNSVLAHDYLYQFTIVKLPNPFLILVLSYPQPVLPEFAKTA